MSNKKMNNLFVKSRRAAAIALLAALPFAQARANNEQSLQHNEQIEQTTNNDTGRNPNAVWFTTVFLLSICVPWWTYMMIDSRKHPEKWRGLERGI